MIIELQPSVTPQDRASVAESLDHPLRTCRPVDAGGRQFLVVSGRREDIDVARLTSHPAVLTVSPWDTTSYFCRREFRPHGTTPVRVGDVTLGTGDLVLIAGVCAVESRDDLMATAEAVKRAGAHALRGGAVKPRTNPYNFQGLGVPGWKMLAEAGREQGLPVVSEVLDPADIEIACEYVDMIQVGARNMTNQALLKHLGSARRPVLLKRGGASRLEELIGAAEFLAVEGNPHVALCERGIQTFETATRYTLDLSAVPVLRRMTHLPLVVDPSHAPASRELVPELALAAAVLGADALLLEVHVDPARMTRPGDAVRALLPNELVALVERLRDVLAAVDRRLHPPA